METNDLFKGVGPVIPRTNYPVTTTVPLGVFNNEYDEYYRPMYNQEMNRGANQSVGGRIFNGLLSRGISILPKMGAGLGNVIGAGQALIEWDITKVWDNPISNAFQQMDEGLREALPVYKSRQYLESGLLGKMGTASFWADDGFDMLAYAASAFVPGKVIGKGLQLGSKLLSTSEVSKDVLAGLKAIGVNSHRTNLVASTAYNTIAESGVEAYQTQKDIEALLIAKKEDPTVAKQKAGEAAARVFRNNLWVLAGPNLLQNIFFHGSWNSSVDKVRKSVWEGLTTAKKESLLVGAAAGIGAEGFWEENAQTSLQQAEKYLATYNTTDRSWEELFANGMVNNTKGFFKSFLPGVDESPEEVEGAVSIFLGGLLGGVVGAGGTHMSNKQAEKLFASEKSRYDALFTGNIGKAAELMMIENYGSPFYKEGKTKVKLGDQEFEVNNYKLDANGKPIQDPKAIERLASNSLKNKKLYDAYMSALYRNDPFTAEIIKQQVLASHAYYLKSSEFGYTDAELGQYLDQYGETGAEQAKQLGIETLVKDNVATIKDYIAQLSEISNRRGSAKVDVDDSTLSKFNIHMTRTELYLNARKKAIENATGFVTTDKGAEALANLLDDTNEYLRLATSQSKELEEQYKNSIFDPLVRYQKHNELVKKTKRTPEEEDEMNKLAYETTEDIAVNGNWLNSDASRLLPGGAELKTLVRVSPGTADLAAAALGMTINSLNNVESEIEDPNADVNKLAEDFVYGIQSTSPEIDARREALRAPLAEKIQEQLTSSEGHIQKLITQGRLLDELSDFEEEIPLVEKVAKILETNPEDPEVQEAIKYLMDNGIVTKDDVEFTEDFVVTTLPIRNALLAKVNEQYKTQINLRAKAGKLYQMIVDNEHPNLDKVSARLSKITNAADAMEALQLDFFENWVKAPADQVVSSFNFAPEDFEDEATTELSMYRLRLAKAAYSGRGNSAGVTKTLAEIDKYLTLIGNTIVPRLQENLNKRAEIHRVINNDVVGSTLVFIGSSAKDPIYALLEKILGTEPLNSIFVNVFDNPVLSLDALGALMQQTKAKATPEQFDVLLAEIAKARTAKVKEYLDDAEALGINVGNLRSSSRPLEVRTTYNLPYVIGKYFKGRDLDLLRRYKADGDLNSFVKLASKSTEFTTADIKFLEDSKELQDTIIGTNLLEEFGNLDSGTYSKILAAKESLKGTLPSLQQNLVLTQLLIFLVSDTARAGNLSNWSLVRGIAGSGKTFMMKILLDLYKDVMGSDKVYAFSSNPEATSNINSVLFSKPTDSSLNKFLGLSLEEISKLDFIVVDEVFTFTNEQVGKIDTKVREAKSKLGKAPKVISLGDPSQSSKEEEPEVLEALGIFGAVPLTTSYRTNVSAISSFIRRYQLTTKPVVSPIATSNASPDTINETSIGVIGVPLLQFEEALSRPSKRSRVIITATPELKSYYSRLYPTTQVRLISEAQGYQWDEVFTVVNESNISLDIFEENRSLYTAYSRAKELLVIANGNVVNSLSEDLSSNVAVAQDEIAKAGEMFNTNVTMANRTKSLLDGTTGFTASQVEPETVESSVEPFTAPNTVSNPQYAEIEDFEPEIPDLPPVETTATYELSYPSNYGFKTVTLADGKLTSHIANNSIGHIVRAIDERTSTSNPETIYYILVESHINPKHYLVIGALGNEDFMGPAGEYFNSILSNPKAISKQQIEERTIMHFPSGIEGSAIGHVVIKSFQRYKTVHSGPEGYGMPFLPGAKDVVEDALIRFYLSYYGTTSNGAVIAHTHDPKKRWVTVKQVGGQAVYTVNWKNISPTDVQVMIPTKTRTRDRNAFGWNESEFNPPGRDLNIAYGVPHLIINAKHVDKNGNVTTKKNYQLIPLQPVKFSKASKYYKALREFYDAAVALEKASGLFLGTEEFEKVVTDYAHENFEVVQDHSGGDTPKYSIKIKEKVIPVEEYGLTPEAELPIQQVVLSLFGYESRPKFFSDEIDPATNEVITSGKDLAEQFIADIDEVMTTGGKTYKVLNGERVIGVEQRDWEGKEMWVITTSSDVPGHETSVLNIYHERMVYGGKGPAQEAINTIASANLTFGHSRMQLRQKAVIDRNGRKVTIGRAPSLLSADGYTDYDAFYRDPIVMYLLGDNYQRPVGKGGYGKLIEDLAARIKALDYKPTWDTDATSPTGIAYSLIGLYSTHEFTTALLEVIVGDEFFDEKGEHVAGDTYLREPLQLHTLNGTGINDYGRDLGSLASRAALSKLVRHNFLGVRRTSVSYGIPTDVPKMESPAADSTVPQTVGEVFARLQPKTPLVQELMATLSKLPVNNIRVQYSPKGIPIEDPANPGKYIFLPGMYATRLEDGEPVIWVEHDVETIVANQETTTAFLHEVLHALTMAPLRKGKADARKKIDSAEALLYKRLSILKKRFDSAIKSKINPATGKRYKTSEVYQLSRSIKDVDEFVGSLSNETFARLAKATPVTPKGTRKSILRELIESIIDFFKSLFPNPNVYASAVASIENFYSVVAEQTSSPLPTQTEAAVPKTLESVKKDFEDRVVKMLSVADEYLFQSNLDTVHKLFGHILKDLPESYGEEITITYQPAFLSAPESEQLAILLSVTTHASKTNFAYTNLPINRTYAVPGTIYSTTGLANTVDRVFNNVALEPKEKNLLRSLCILTITEDENLLKDIVAAGEDRLALGLVYFNRVFSNKDRNEFSLQFNASLEEDLLLKMFGTDNPTLESILKVQSVLASRPKDIDFIKQLTLDRGPMRYSSAKSYIRAALQANAKKNGLVVDSPENLIKTRPQVLKQLKESLKDPNQVLPIGLTVGAAIEELNGLYSQLASLQGRTSRADIAKYNKLLTDTIPAYEDSIAGFMALRERDSKTGELIFDIVVRDLFPKYTFGKDEELALKEELDQLAEDRIISDVEAKSEMEEASGILEHIKKYNKSYEFTIFDSVKDLLSDIQLKGRTISTGLAYIKMMQLVITLDWNKDLSLIATQLKNRKAVTFISELDKAVIDKLLSTINSATVKRFVDGVELLFPTNMGVAGFIDSDGLLKYVAYNIDNPNVTELGLTYVQLQDYRSIEGVRVSPAFTTTDRLYQWLRAANPTLTVPQFNRLFTREESINALRGVMQAMGSMKETHLYIAQRQNKYGRMFTTFMRAKASNIAYTIRDSIIYRLKELHKSGEIYHLRDKVFIDTKVDGRPLEKYFYSGNVGDRTIFIKKFFEILGLGELSAGLSLSRTDAATFLHDIQGFLSAERINETVLRPYDEEEEFAEEVEDAGNSFEDWVEDMSYITRFAQVLATSDEAIRNPSVQTASGEKFYVYHEASSAYDTLGYFTSGASEAVKGATGINDDMTIPEHLLASIYDSNIFVGRAKGSLVNHIYEVGEIEGSTNVDTGTLTPYNSMNKFFFYHVDFSQCFMDGLRQYRNSYFQPVYSLDRPKLPIARVGILSDNGSEKPSKIRRAIRQILEQLYTQSTVGVEVPVANYDKSIKNDLFRNFKIAEKVIKDNNLSFTKANLERIGDLVYEEMSAEASRVLDQLLADNVQFTFDARTYAALGHNAKLLNPKFPLPKENMAGGGRKARQFQSKTSGKYDVKHAEVLPLFDLYFKNSYINGYFLNQLINGDYAFYKGPDDIVKRNSSLWGPGVRLLVDPTIGARPKYKTLILNDTPVTLGELRQSLLNIFYEGQEPTGKELSDFERTFNTFKPKQDSSLDELAYYRSDAQGFFMPRRVHELSRGTDRHWGLGSVHKPLHFALDLLEVSDNFSTAKPTLKKYSAINLTDDVIGDRFIMLKKLREIGEILGVDEIIFASGVKEGIPLVQDENGVQQELLTVDQLLALDEAQLRNIRDNWKVSPVVELSNRSYRLQYNPTSDPNQSIALPTQLMYFLNVYADNLSNGNYATTQEAAVHVYELLGELISMGREDFFAKIDTPKKFRAFLEKEFTGPGSGRALDLVSNDISHNFPLLEKKSIIALASGLEANTIKIRLPGGKLVLQANEGTRKLSYKVENISGKKVLVAECIVPKELLTNDQLEQLKLGNSIYAMPDLIGFRIPTTETHSAVLLRIVDIYSTSKQANVILMPPEISPIQGSDYDVDVLFVMSKEVLSESESYVVSSSYIKQFMDSLSTTFALLEKKKEVANPDEVRALHKLLSDIKKAAGLSKDVEEAYSTIDQRIIEEEYKAFEAAERNKFATKFDATIARKSFAKKKGYFWNGESWEPSNIVVARYNKIMASINEFVDNNPQHEDLVAPIVSMYQELANIHSPKASVFYGSQNHPVGYTLKSGQLHFQDDQLQHINQQIEELSAIKNSLQSDLRPVFGALLTADIRKLKSIKQKYIKNYLSHVIMDILGDEANKHRQMSSISFRPITDAIATIPKELLPNINYDLSSPDGRWQAYNAVSTSQKLTGQFANSAKAFGYLARAGATPQIIKFYNFRDTVKAAIELNAQMKNENEFLRTNEEMQEVAKSIAITAIGFGIEVEPFDKADRGEITSLLNKILDKLDKNRSEYVTDNFAKVNTAPTLQQRYQFDLEIDNLPCHFDTLRTKDVLGKWKVTEILDALVNEAIDNLKRGELSQARINGVTSSSVVALASLGVPINFIIKLLYQPILYGASSGLTNNASQFFKLIETKYKDELAALEDAPLSDTELDEFLTAPYHKFQTNNLDSLEKLSQVDLIKQLRVYVLFKKAYNIGQDLRAVSDMLNVVRKLEVFVEDIFQVEADLENKIGKIEKVDGQLILVPKPDFSFVVTNLFESAPHIKEAYKTYEELVAFIHKEYLLHSKPIVELSKAVLRSLDSDAVEGENTSAKTAAIRKSLSFYLLAGREVDRLGELSPKIMKTRNGDEYAISGLRNFSNSVAERLYKIKEYVRNQKGPNRIHNKFLTHVAIVYDSANVSRISFKSGIGLSAEDVQDIYIGFKDLNRFAIENGEVKEVVPDTMAAVSDFQKDMLSYAVLNYGLAFSTSNYSNYIPAYMLNIIDQEYGTSLKAIAELPEEEQKHLVRHFGLSYSMQNASKLSFVVGPSLEPTAVIKKVDAPSTSIYAGTEIVDNERIYFDLKVKRITTDKNGAIINAPSSKYIRRGSGKNPKVYYQIYDSPEYYYYTEVGKPNNTFHYSLPPNTPYYLTNYFNPLEASIPYHVDDSKSIFTYSKLIRSLNPGDEIWIYPVYNIDRTRRKKVTVKSITPSKSTLGARITYEPVEAQAQAVEEPTLPEVPIVPPASKVQYSSIDYHAEKVFSKAERNEEHDYELGSNVYESITGKVLPKFQTKPFTSTDTPGTRAAEDLWKDLPEDAKQVTKLVNEEVDKATYAKLYDQQFELYQARGAVVHAKIHKFVSKNPEAQATIDDLYQTYGLLPSDFAWLSDKVITEILASAGINAYAADSKLATDKVYSERPITSDLLGWGGTPDLFVDHGDHTYSIYDLKTGGLDALWEGSLLKMGQVHAEDAFDNARNRAKLQVMLYAFMTKVEDPKAAFVNLELMHVKSKFDVNKFDHRRKVNPAAYLTVIEGTLKRDMPEKYKLLKDTLSPEHFRSLFDPATYMVTDEGAFSSLSPNTEPAVELQLKILKLQSLILFDRTQPKGTHAATLRRQEISVLTDDIIKLRRNPLVPISAWSNDIGWLDRYFGSASYSTNPYVQMYYSFLTAQKQKVRNEYTIFRAAFDTLIEKLRKHKGLAPATNWVGGTNRKELFKFAFTNRAAEEGGGVRLITDKDTDLWNKLDAVEKEFLLFVNKWIGKFFVDELSDYVDPRTGQRVAMANKVVTYREVGNYEKKLTSLDLFNKKDGPKNRKKPWKYYEGFFPKYAPQLYDIVDKFGTLSANTAKFVWSQYFTNYFEYTFEGWGSTEEAIPLKYLDNPDINRAGSFTMNLELAVDNFVKQSIYKLHMDEVYSMAKGIQIYLEVAQDQDENVSFKKLVEYFEDAINIHVLGQRQKEFTVSGRSFGRVTSKGDYLQFNWAKFLYSLKNFFLGPTMWLKLFPATSNAIFASIVSLKEAFRNSVGSNGNFTLGDLMQGFGVAIGLIIRDGLIGDSAYRRNKAFLLMEKFGYMPDSYDWYTRPNQLMTSRNKLFTTRTAMFMHTIPEEVISTAIFVAQLKAMKFTKADGTVTNVWDSYSIEPSTDASTGVEVGIPVWKGGVRGKLNVSRIHGKPQYIDVTEPTNEEINSVKFLYEKIHGSYRGDERAAAEYYILGQMTLQLKKYLPGVLKNIWASRGVRETQGFYEEIDENGTKVLRWTPQLIEGRWRLVLGGLYKMLRLKRTNSNGEAGNKIANFLGITYNEAYDFSNIPENQRRVIEEDLYDFYLTSTILLIMFIGSLMLFGPDDKDDTMYKMYGRIMNDVAGTVNPWEVSKNLSNITPVSWSKGRKLFSASGELLWSSLLYTAGYDDEALTKEGNLRGLTEVQRNVHFLSAYHDFFQKVEDTSFFGNDSRLK